MSDVKFEQIENLLKSGFGFDDDDLNKLKTEDIQDLTPYVQKMQSHIREVLTTDTEFVDSLTKPFKDAPIGKENQLKKEVRKYFGLQIAEDELKKTPFSELLKRGTETMKTTVNADVEKLQQAAAEWMEKYEALEASIPTKIQEVEQQFTGKIKEKETHEQLLNLAATEVAQISKENLPHFVISVKGYAREMGHKFIIDDNKNIKILDSEGLPLKNAEGHLVKAKDYVKSFYNNLASNVAPKSSSPVSPSLASNSKYTDLLSKMGKGFN
jgi:hypothetical protein